MSNFPQFRRMFRLPLRDKRSATRDIDDEIETHLAMRIEFLQTTGLSEDDARAEAMRRFGDFNHGRKDLIAHAEKRAQTMNMQDTVESLMQDVRFALRQIRRSPRNAYFGVISLALGIGLATAFFAAVDGVLLRPLPFRDSKQLVSLQSVDSAGNSIVVVSDDDWYDWNTRNKTFDGIALHGLTFRTSVVIGGEPVRVSSVVAVPHFFSVVGARMVYGRDFDDTDAQTAAGVIISEALWKRSFNSRRDSLTVRLNDRTLQVIGVVAHGQSIPADADIWVPYLHRQIGGAARNNINWFAVGRVKRNATIQSAQADLTQIARSIHAETPQSIYTFGVHVIPLRDQIVNSAELYLQLLMGAVFVVLLIACVNLASINLARGSARAREMAVRAAIGASRKRLVRQLLVEHLVLASVGGILGVTLAFGLIRAIISLSFNQLPRTSEISIDLRVLLFAVVSTAVVGLLTGLLPALQAGRTSLSSTMALAGRGVSRGWSNAGRALVASEIALAVVLVTGGGLLLQSFRALISTPLGYQTHGIITAELSLNGQRYRSDTARMERYWPQLLESLRKTRGVSAAGAANWIPLGMGGKTFIDVEGLATNSGGGYRVVSSGYFAALGIPLVNGRDFTDNDGRTAPRVGVVNRAMAQAFWPGENPIGKRLRSPSMERPRDGSASPWITVVGVVGDVRHWGAESEFEPELYVHYAQLPNWWRTLTIAVRSSLPTGEATQVVRSQIHALDPLIAADIEPFDARLDRNTADRHFTMTLLVGFGVMALVLAAIGVYSVLAFQVTLRTRELAVRAALGAERGRILRLVMISGAQFILLGVTVGVVSAIALSRIMESLMFHVSAHDPVVFVLASVVIVVAAFAAAFIPALRATRVQPMLALQQE